MSDRPAMSQLELAAMLSEEMNRHEDVRTAVASRMARLGVDSLEDYVDGHPEDFKILATALIGMVDQVDNVRGSRET